MNEVRLVWSSISSSHPSWASAVSSQRTDARATWYDSVETTSVVPSDPVVISDNRDTVGTKMEGIEKTDSVLQPKEGNDVEVEEVLYQNNVEAALNSLSKVCVKPLKTDLESVPPTVEDSIASDQRRRHSSSIEITATSSLNVDQDGMPTISFSFLPADTDGFSGIAQHGNYSDNVQIETTSNLAELYDFPNKPAQKNEHSGSTDVTNESTAKTKDPVAKIETQDVTRDDWYDVPKIVKDDDKTNATSGGEARLGSEDERNEESDHSPKIKLRSNRSQTLTVPEAERGGFLSTSGSCSEGESMEESHRAIRERRLNRQRRRIGKAWGKMRSWLRDEKSKLGDVVSRHAKMQAVGALSTDNDSEGSMGGSFRNQSATYDLTRKRKLDATSITRVEEFGLSSVYEEGQISDGDALSDVDESNTTTVEVNRAGEEEKEEVSKPVDVDGTGKESSGTRIKFLDSSPGNKTKSSENVSSSTARLTSISFSLDKLCSDGENDENNATSESEMTNKEQSVGKSGLIKQRVLGSIRGLMASRLLLQANEIEEGGQGGFEDVRKYVKQGGDFCKELAAILHERAELEANYAKGLGKLSCKLTKACSRDQGGTSSGGVNEAWRCVGEEMDAAAEAHRIWGLALGEQLAKPLRVGVAEAQGRARKVIENSVDKAAKSLQEWRNVAAKSKKQSFACARENERLQDLARIQSMSQGQQNNNKSSNHHMTEKEANKLETRKRKSEDASRRADTEFYTISVRAERARLEYESTIRKGAKQMELLEEERLSALKDLANVYLAHLHALSPRLQQSSDRLATPVRSCDVLRDVEILKNLTRRIDNDESTNAEQLLPDFYAEHVTLAMNRERRKQALIRVLHLIRQDLEREKRGREGLETLHRAFIKTPAFAADESTQNVTEKLHHMRSMLTYLEAARYKVGGALLEIEGGKRGKHPLAQHILVSRDRQGLQQSVLKVPNWIRNESLEQLQEAHDDLDNDRITKEHETDNRDWVDRTAGDGNSENPPDEEDFSDFDEFSSHSEDNNNQDIESTIITAKNDRVTEQCRALYQYSANLNDELTLVPGDLITIHDKQADGWWVGECRGKRGIFPATYVQLIR